MLEYVWLNPEDMKDKSVVFLMRQGRVVRRGSGADHGYLVSVDPGDAEAYNAIVRRAEENRPASYNL